MSVAVGILGGSYSAQLISLGHQKPVLRFKEFIPLRHGHYFLLQLLYNVSAIDYSSSPPILTYDSAYLRPLISSDSCLDVLRLDESVKPFKGSSRVSLFCKVSTSSDCSFNRFLRESTSAHSLSYFERHVASLDEISWRT
ncbi:hypothetical protein M404DRAFT_232016 [Pisolithus tinctorius Marx 270]|uniref:Uncharacterized protein n=1 Tax=Pisolithus tinctorius Marx 270 TaxID=870435 RepID=A0A0C3KKI2_PISTI|nr:hypothetical protein M404DRAFT_232016 [Pisolithus tinctorius Marx 270]